MNSAYTAPTYQTHSVGQSHHCVCVPDHPPHTGAWCYKPCTAALPQLLMTDHQQASLSQHMPQQLFNPWFPCACNCRHNRNLTLLVLLHVG